MRHLVTIVTLGLALLLMRVAITRAQESSGTTSPGKQMHYAVEELHGEVAGMKMTADVDRDFAAMMIAHHRSAIRMARIEAGGTGDPVLRQLALDVIRTRTLEVAALESWLRGHPASGKPEE